MCRCHNYLKGTNTKERRKVAESAKNIYLELTNMRKYRLHTKENFPIPSQYVRLQDNLSREILASPFLGTSETRKDNTSLVICSI